MQPSKFIRRPEVLELTQLKRTTLYEMEKRGEFPAHFMLTPKCAAWDRTEVEAWMAERKAAPIALQQAMHNLARQRTERRSAAAAV